MTLASILVPLKLARGQNGQVLLFKKTAGSLTVALTRSSKVHGQITEAFFPLSFAKLCTKQSLQTGEQWRDITLQNDQAKRWKPVGKDFSKQTG